MSSVITGDQTAATVGLTATIIGATNATPIVIQTSADHLYSTGDVVAISGVLGNLGANGLFTIAKVDATHFSLTGSAGTGAWTSGGTAKNTCLTPAFQIPSDGDGPGINAADVAVAFEALADRTQRLASLAGRTPTRIVLDTPGAGAGRWPDDIAFVEYEMIGGGGGGGGGGAQNSGDTGGCGGGGGGSAQGVYGSFVPTPGAAYAYFVGAGGAGGAGGVNAAGASGSAGETSYVTGIAIAKGADPGVGGSIGNGTTRKAVNGGSPIRDTPGGALNTNLDVASGVLVSSLPPGHGGHGYNYPHGGSPLLISDPQNGSPSAQSDGGAGGAAGADGAGASAGGGGGGGGGSGGPGWPGGAGAVGGAGGAGSNSVDLLQAPGAAGAQGTGPGAGGSGGGGGGTIAVGGAGEDGGAGAAGRAGVIILKYFTVT